MTNAINLCERCSYTALLVVSSLSHVFGEICLLKVTHLALVALQLLDYLWPPTVHDHVLYEFGCQYLEALIQVTLAPGICQKFEAGQGDLVHVGEYFIWLCCINVHDEFEDCLILARITFQGHRTHYLLE